MAPDRFWDTFSEKRPEIRRRLLRHAESNRREFRGIKCIALKKIYQILIDALTGRHHDHAEANYNH
jgi:hypothetical protein